eukprot:TRINITY_DN23399_c0_g1_i2.p1 TRINITY_DN23399_c0_g1~~TRINITY_DN23399_c0_g1_i2.p1  ORF type:complete len:274 (-),score=86.50 TRINITY_DN23399_c0_g1_i2:34-855(-)
MEQTTYQEEYDFSLELVKKCGEVIKSAFNVEKKISEKSSANDLVTETDQLVEKMLIDGLKEKFPDTRFIGEESVAGGEKCELTSAKTWIIDPIDGTTNFISSNPHICTILGFMVDKEVEFGIVYNPVLDQLWTARKGLGAFYNGKKIQVSTCTELSKSLLIQEMYDSSEVKLAMVFNNLQTFVPKVRGLRAYGSAGINLAYLAMGAVDAYFDCGFHIWDYAAPLLIVTEAGGVAMDITGGKVDYLARRMLAASSKDLADQILPSVATVPMERD